MENTNAIRVEKYKEIMLNILKGKIGLNRWNGVLKLNGDLNHKILLNDTVTWLKVVINKQVTSLREALGVLSTHPGLATVASQNHQSRSAGQSAVSTTEAPSPLTRVLIVPVGFCL